MLVALFGSMCRYFNRRRMHIVEGGLAQVGLNERCALEKTAVEVGESE